MKIFSGSLNLFCQFSGNSGSEDSSSDTPLIEIPLRDEICPEYNENLVRIRFSRSLSLCFSLHPPVTFLPTETNPHFTPPFRRGIIRLFQIPLQKPLEETTGQGTGCGIEAAVQTKIFHSLSVLRSIRSDPTTATAQLAHPAVQIRIRARAPFRIRPLG